MQVGEICKVYAAAKAHALADFIQAYLLIFAIALFSMTTECFN